MHQYDGVTTRFLHEDERLILSKEREMPLVIEPNESSNMPFLTTFLTNHSAKLLDDIAQYGAVLLRGFEVATDDDFEKTILAIRGFQPISDAFMAEEGRVAVGDLKYVLHTNAVYKTGGTVYLGGFHSENYYTSDVPGYICFYCNQPSLVGGETGLINMEKVYEHLDAELKERLKKNSFFVSKWLISEVSKRYQITEAALEKICRHFDLPIVGQGNEKFILMYKPSIFEHPVTKKNALQINFFEIASLNKEMRHCFMADYQGKTWFWHRLVWRLPPMIMKTLELFYLMFASFFYSPKEALKNLQSKFNTRNALSKQNKLPVFNETKVGSCFNDDNVKDLAQLLRDYYCSCLWKKGDILLVDNRKVVHAGMPGAGPRLIRALVCNPLEMKYSFQPSGMFDCQPRESETVGYYMSTATVPEQDNVAVTN